MCYLKKKASAFDYEILKIKVRIFVWNMCHKNFFILCLLLYAYSIDI